MEALDLVARLEGDVLDKIWQDFPADEKKPWRVAMADRPGRMVYLVSGMNKEPELCSAIVLSYKELKRILKAAKKGDGKNVWSHEKHHPETGAGWEKGDP